MGTVILTVLCLGWIERSKGKIAHLFYSLEKNIDDGFKNELRETVRTKLFGSPVSQITR